MANGNPTLFAVKLEHSFLVKLFRAECRTLENILEVVLLEIFERQKTMLSVFPQDIVRVYIILAPKLATVKTITCIFALLITVSTSHFWCVTFFDCQNIEQIFQVETVWQSFHAATLGNSHRSIWKSGHLIFLWRGLVLAKSFRHSRQKICKHDSCLGSSYK